MQCFHTSQYGTAACFSMREKHVHRVRVLHRVRTVCSFSVAILRIFRLIFRVAGTRWLQGFTYNNGGLHSMVVVAAHTPCREGGGGGMGYLLCAARCPRRGPRGYALLHSLICTALLRGSNAQSCSARMVWDCNALCSEA